MKTFSQSMPPADRTGWTGAAASAPSTAKIIAAHWNSLVAAVLEIRSGVPSLPSEVGAAPAAAAVPTGGSSGQVLAKTSSSNYAVGWATPSSTGTVPDATTATKGITTYGTTSGTAAQGNDSRLSDARTPTTHTHTASQVSDATTLGRSVLTASTAAAARTALGTGAPVLVLSASAAVPGGTPAGTVILRQAA